MHVLIILIIIFVAICLWIKLCVNVVLSTHRKYLYVAKVVAISAVDVDTEAVNVTYLVYFKSRLWPFWVKEPGLSFITLGLAQGFAKAILHVTDTVEVVTVIETIRK